jgi:hypothetical protein
MNERMNRSFPGRMEEVVGHNTELDKIRFDENDPSKKGYLHNPEGFIQYCVRNFYDRHKEEIQRASIE